MCTQVTLACDVLPPSYSHDVGEVRHFRTLERLIGIDDETGTIPEEGGKATTKLFGWHLIHLLLKLVAVEGAPIRIATETSNEVIALIARYCFHG